MNSNVSVFCGSKRNLKEVYFQYAFELGHRLAVRKVRVMCGGCDSGLMESLVAGIYEGKGVSIGHVCTDPLLSEKPSPLLQYVVDVSCVNARKTALIDGADTYILLPGGLGTMDEFFDALSQAKNTGREVRVGILNIDGYFNGLINFLDSMLKNGFVSDKYKKCIVVSDDPESLMDKLYPL